MSSPQSHNDHAEGNIGRAAASIRSQGNPTQDFLNMSSHVSCLFCWLGINLIESYSRNGSFLIRFCNHLQLAASSRHFPPTCPSYDGLKLFPPLLFRIRPPLAFLSSHGSPSLSQFFRQLSPNLHTWSDLNQTAANCNSLPCFAHPRRPFPTVPPSLIFLFFHDPSPALLSLIIH